LQNFTKLNFQTRISNKLEFLRILKNTSMKLTITFLFRAVCTAFVLLLSTTQLSAQDSCTFRLRCTDSYGDGWDDSQVYIRLGSGSERAYTNSVTGPANVATNVFFDIRVRTGDSIWVRYESQSDFEGEISYALLDNTGTSLITDGPRPLVGIAYRGVAKCRNCGAPAALVVPDVRTNNATARWLPAARGFQSTYTVQWDTAGFVYGRGRGRLRTTDTFAVMQGLTEFVKYDVYVQTICFGNDSSTVVGPTNFQTDTATDLSVARILGPGNGCSLGADSIKILIKNIGGVPQQLFQYKASVNGVNLPISVPADGLFTGVLSKDSTASLAFRTLYDFSPIGEYIIKAWTEVGGDRNRKNDTATLTVTHPRTVGTFPYYQNFELGKDTWFVTDSIGNSTWQYAQPRGRVITSAASGTQAWTTWADSTYRTSEFSYVNSPCLNLSSFTADPRISLNIHVNSDAASDGAWMESSVDNGLTWQMVGGRRINGGINWYNDSIAAIARPTWGGTVDSVKNWRLAQNILRGTAGRSNVRLRIGFRSDAFSSTSDGFAFDNVLISAAPTTDFASSAPVTNVNISSCSDSVVNNLVFRVANAGTTAQRSFSLNYQVNGGATITETLDSLIAPNQTLVYRSTKPFRTIASGNYTIKSWVALVADQQILNDSVTTVLRITAEKPLLVNTFPYFQNFENGSGTWSAADSLNGSWGLVAPTGSPINTAASGAFAFKVGATPTNTYNNSEWSYLVSPCFDFTTLTADPRISFALNVHAEKLGTTTYDGAWLEGSTNGGTTWTRIGTRNTGINWYADTINGIGRGVWSGINAGWKPAQNTLTGYAGKPNCRFRFVFRSDGSGTVTNGLPYGGIAVDDIFIGPAANVDLAAGGANRLDLTTCGQVADTVTMNITNLGTTRQFRFNANYRIDNLTPVTELIDSTLNILPGQSAIYKFRTPFNSTALGNHTITTWVTTSSDGVPANDSVRTTYFIPSAIGTFASYNFDNGLPPQYWTVPTTNVGIGGHGNVAGNGYLFSNIYSFNANVSFTTHRFGPVRSAKDSISFDYRFVNFSSPNPATIFLPANKDTFMLQAALDCETNFVNLDTITAANHVPTTAYQTHKFSLGRFQGRSVRFRFRMVTLASTSSADYYADIDNINFLTCPESFGIQASVRNSRVGATLGSVALLPATAGIAPYTYLWNNGRTTDSIGGLAAGTYTVTITDGRGCTQTGVYTVQNTVGTFDVSSIFSKVTLAPNPTTGNTTLNLELNRPMSARIQVLNVMGQLLYEKRSQTSEANQQYELDMSDRPAGVYLVRIVADNRSFTTKLVKQ
jgi:Secretion system C-terminal sorting domain